MTSFNDNPIIVDVNSRRNKKQKILCVLCKIPLDCVSEDEMRYKCPRCKNTYQLGYEILEHEDDFESSHEDEDIELSGLESSDSGVGLLTKDNEFAEDDEEKEYNSQKKSDIPIPKYMQNSDTTEVIEYREE